MMKFKKMIAVLLTLCMALALLPGAVLAAEAETVPMYRLYNPNSGEHFYTGSIEERDNLVSVGWNYEGVAWNAPINGGTPVHRVFNPNNGDHHYTMSMEEVENLKAIGWQYEGVCWNSAAGGSPQYRLYNPNADLGSHHYTSSVEERENLVSLGWIFEGIGWYGVLPEGHAHSYNSMVIEPTCTEKGYTLWYCVCGDSYTDNEVGTKDHEYTSEVTAAATCTEDGVKTFTCSCGSSYTETIKATGHAWGNWVVTKEPTTSAEGEETRTCTRTGCGKTETRKIDKLPSETEPPHSHSYSEKVTKAATCTEDGVKTFTCSCGNSYTESIPKTGHSWGEWVRTKEPTTEAEGEDTRTCSACGKTETRAVEKLPSGCTSHSWGNWTSDNYGSYGSCTNCGQSITIDGSTSSHSEEVINIINEYRAAEGLDPVAWYASKTLLIRAHELTVCPSHNRPDGSWGEGTCIAGGYSSAQAVVDAWMNSSGHRGNLMNPDAVKASAAYNGNCWVLYIGQ